MATSLSSEFDSLSETIRFDEKPFLNLYRMSKSIHIAIKNNQTSIHVKEYNTGSQNDTKNNADIILMYMKKRLCMYIDLKN